MTQATPAVQDTDRTTAHDGAGQVTVATYRNYREAQQAVDRLSDQAFPVEQVTIIGHGLSSVERVTGRLTTGRAALAGAATGAWFGLLVGLLFGLFVPGLVWLTVLVSSIVLGGVWGAAIGFVTHWATRGRRDFTSLRALTAERYEVTVEAGTAGDAARILAAGPN